MVVMVAVAVLCTGSYLFNRWACQLVAHQLIVGRCLFAEEQASMLSPNLGGKQCSACSACSDWITCM
jgi:hypothetical protein